MSSRLVRLVALFVFAGLLAFAPAAPAATLKVRQSTAIDGATMRVAVKVPTKNTSGARVALQVKTGSKWKAVKVGTVKKGKVTLTWTSPDVKNLRVRLVVRRKGKVVAVTKSWVAKLVVVAKPVVPAPAAPAPAAVPEPVWPTPAARLNTLATGGRHGCAILADRTIRCWGDNSSGAVGDGTTTNRLVPVAVKGLTGATSIAAGTDHVCTLLGNGAVYCWGSGSAGQLGDGSHDASRRSTTPVRVPVPADIDELRVGGSLSCARSTAEGWRCWGDGVRAIATSGGSSDWSPTPTAVVVAVGSGTVCTRQNTGPVPCSGSTSGFPSDVIAVDGFGQLTCGLLPGGTVRCRMPNGGGVSWVDTSVPGATDLAVSPEKVCVARGASPVTCFDVSKVASGAAAVPLGDVRGTAGVVRLSGSGGYCGTTGAGAAICWGDPTSGGLGDGRSERIGLPVPSNVGTDLSPVVLGAHGGCGLRGGGATCWGTWKRGQQLELFPATTTATGTSTVRSLFFAGDGICGVTTATTVVCWGRVPGDTTAPGTGAQLAYGATPAVTVADLDGVSPVGGASLGSNACVVRAGEIVCWGGTSPTPGDWTAGTPRAPIDGFSGVTKLAGAAGGLCAIVADGVRCAASDQYGLGGRTPTGTPGAIGDPLTLPGSAGATDLDVGPTHACYVKGGGVWCWGSNAENQVALTPNPSGLVATEVPQQISGLTGIVAVAVGDSHSCALGSNGRVRCWGANDRAQRGFTDLIDGIGADEIEGIDDAVSITAGGDDTCVTRRSHALTCWGDRAGLPYPPGVSEVIAVPPSGLGTLAPR